MIRTLIFGLCLLVISPAQAYLDFDSSAQAKAKADAMVQQGAQIKSQLSALNRAFSQAEESYNEINWRGPQVAQIDAAITEIKAQKFDSSTFDMQVGELRSERWHRNTENNQRAFQEQLDGNARIDHEIARLREDIAELEAVKKRALQELRDGLYCSQCNRPKSQIENEERETFREHLGRVSGRAKSASPEQIQRKSDEFDAKIARLEARIPGIEKKREAVKQKVARLEQQALEKDRAFDERIKQLESKREQTEKSFAAQKKSRIKKLAQQREGVKAQHQNTLDKAGEKLRALGDRKFALERKYNDTELAYRNAHWQMRHLREREDDAVAAALKEQALAAQSAARQAALEAKRAEFKAQQLAKKRERVKRDWYRQSYSSNSSAGSGSSKITPESYPKTQIDNLAKQQRNAEKQLRKLQQQQAKAQRDWQHSEQALAEGKTQQAIRTQRSQREQLALLENSDSPFNTETSSQTGLNKFDQAKLQLRERMQAQLARINTIDAAQANNTAEKILASTLQNFVGTLPQAGKKVRERVLYKRKQARGFVNETWREGREAFKESYNKEIDNAAKRGWTRFLSSQQQGLSGRLSDTVRGSIHRLTPDGQIERLKERFNPKERAKYWKNKVKGYLRDKSIRIIARNDYQNRTQDSWENANKFEHDTEVLFIEARFIAPPKEYLNNLMKAFARTTLYWEATFLGDINQDEDLIR